MAVNIQLKDFTSKTTLVPADLVYAANSADSYNEIKTTVAGLFGAYPALLSIGSLITAANQYIYTTGIDTYAVATITPIPTISHLAAWDANKNLSAINLISGFTTQATAAGTTVLTVASSEVQEFTGSSTQTVTLPVASTLVAGQGFTIINNSSGAVTVNSSGGNLVQAMAAGTTLRLTCVLITGTTAASWSYSYQISAFPLSVVNGGTGVSSVTTAPGASAWAGWDVNSNMSANAFIEGFATTATAGGTTVLTVASKQIQEFTGTLTQTVTLPVTSTLIAGMYFDIVNNSSGVLTINSSGGNLILSMAANTSATVLCVLNSGTTAASWNASYFFDNGAGVLSITGTANQVIASASTGAVVLSLPQSIATNSAVTFASVNKLAITAPATLSTLTILDGKTLTSNNTLIFAGTDGSTIQCGAGGTVAYTVSGTFTPVLQFGGASVGITYTIQTGYYTTHGNTLTFVISIILSNKGSSTGAATITGLPTASRAGPIDSFFAYGSSNLTFTLQPLAAIDGGSSTVQLIANNSATSLSVFTNTNFANNTALYITGTYLI